MYNEYFRLAGKRTDPLQQFLLVLFQRLSVRGPGQMPPLASTVADPVGQALLRDWLDALGESQVTSAAQLQVESGGATLRLRAKQPANQSIRLEMATNLLQSNWLELDLPGTEVFFPAQPREVRLEPRVSSAPAFFRLTTTQP